MNNEPVEQLTGKIEDILAEGGTQPRMKFTVNVTNKNKCGLVLASLSARLHILFVDGNRGWGGEIGSYVCEAMREGPSNSIQPGDQNTLVFYAPIPLSVLVELEESRNDRDVIVQMAVAYLAVERAAEGGFGQRVLAAELGDPRTNRPLFYLIAKSRWDGILKTFEISEELRASRRILHEIVSDARHAKGEAEGYARDAKAASSLTAITTLSEAYDAEAKALGRTSLWWLLSAIVITLVAGALMAFYVYESFRRDFTPSQTVLRVFVLAAVFAGLGLCLRYYSNYKQMQLLNRHRVNIGRTFEALKAAQPSDQARNLLAAITAEEMVHFGQSTLHGKDSAETQISIVAELLKSFIEKQKA